MAQWGGSFRVDGAVLTFDVHTGPDPFAPITPESRVNGVVLIDGAGDPAAAEAVRAEIERDVVGKPIGTAMLHVRKRIATGADREAGWIQATVDAQMQLAVARAEIDRLAAELDALYEEIVRVLVVEHSSFSEDAECDGCRLVARAVARMAPRPGWGPQRRP